MEPRANVETRFLVAVGLKTTQCQPFRDAVGSVD